ncbi:hypothetical protein JR316_0009076 [Psilocybe cubensis]|uniref:Uncharacterized protein n=2 Tax=Psilocybe cubensis TaxID=181762 RepID=A0ACB8GT32_PSICU|nr:hypothetical protein JR316_0009076 [Psilocybe cubensis]KAH9478619.1 hypothetical protein JR316_0009076 [Psilocybe cubensis]
MALQTSHRSEASSTPTPTSSSGNTTDPNAQQTGFSPAGSPPLILAFLAIGLFSAAMIVVFGWRRVQFGRAWTLGGIPPTEEIRLPRVLPKKPVLWDLWCKGRAGWTEVAGSRKPEHNIKLQWENMAPFTVSTVPLHDPAENSITTYTPPIRDVSLRPRPPFLPFRLRWPNHRSMPPPPPSPPQRHRDSMKSIESSPSTTSRSTLQVGVIIIMPSAQNPTYVRTDSDIKRHERNRHRESEEVVDYSIGIYECPWD